MPAIPQTPPQVPGSLDSGREPLVLFSVSTPPPAAACTGIGWMEDLSPGGQGWLACCLKLGEGVRSRRAPAGISALCQTVDEAGLGGVDADAEDLGYPRPVTHTVNATPCPPGARPWPTAGEAAPSPPQVPPSGASVSEGPALSGGLRPLVYGASAGPKALHWGKEVKQSGSASQGGYCWAGLFSVPCICLCVCMCMCVCGCIFACVPDLCPL